MGRRTPPVPPPGARSQINGRRLSAAQERDWRRASEDLVSGDFARIRQGVERLRHLEADLRAGQAAAEVQRGLADTIVRERSRGEVVEVRGRPEAIARVRIRSRDGLETLHRSGALSDAQFRAGMIYRDLYEAADPERDLRSQMRDLDRSGGGRTPVGAPEAWQERRLRGAQALARVEAKVRSVDRGAAALRALREIAGHARCISQLAAGGGGQASCRGALIAALDVAIRHFGVR